MFAVNKKSLELVKIFETFADGNFSEYLSITSTSLIYSDESQLLRMTDREKRSPLHITCMKGHIQFSEYLINKYIEYGISLHLKDKRNDTPLCLVSSHGGSSENMNKDEYSEMLQNKFKIIKAILSNDSKVDFKNLKNKNNPMHWAIYYGNIKSGLLLFKKLPYLLLMENYDKKTPFEIIFNKVVRKSTKGLTKSLVRKIIEEFLQSIFEESSQNDESMVKILTEMRLLTNDNNIFKTEVLIKRLFVMGDNFNFENMFSDFNLLNNLLKKKNNTDHNIDGNDNVDPNSYNTVDVLSLPHNDNKQEEAEDEHEENLMAEEVLNKSCKLSNFIKMDTPKKEYNQNDTVQYNEEEQPQGNELFGLLNKKKNDSNMNLSVNKSTQSDSEEEDGSILQSNKKSVQIIHSSEDEDYDDEKEEYQEIDPDWINLDPSNKSIQIYHYKDRVIKKNKHILLLHKMLIAAVYIDDLTVAKILMDKFFVNPFVRIINGKSAFLLSIQKGKLNFVQFFLAQKYTDKNSQRRVNVKKLINKSEKENYNNAIHLAIEKNRKEILDVLLEHNIEIKKMNFRNWNPFQMSKDRFYRLKNKSIVKEIERNEIINSEGLFDPTACPMKLFGKHICIKYIDF